MFFRDDSKYIWITYGYGRKQSLIFYTIMQRIFHQNKGIN